MFDIKDKHYLFTTLSCVAFFFNYLLPSDILVLGVLAFWCIYVFFMSRDHLLPSMLYMSFFSFLMRSGTLHLSILLNIAFMLRVLKDTPKRRTFLMGTSLLYLAVCQLSTGTTALNLASFMPELCFLTALFACVAYRESNGRQIFVYYISGFFLSSFLAFFKEQTRLAYIMENDEVYGALESINRYSGLSFDCNFYSVEAVSVVFLLLFRADKMSNAWRIPLLLTSLIIGMFTVSKSYFFCVALLLVYSASFSNSKTKKILLYSTPAVFLAFYLFNNMIITYLDAFMLRMDNITDVDELTTGRTLLWEQYWNIIKASSLQAQLIGYGKLHLLVDKAAHNTYIELLYRYGIIGCIIIIFYLRLMYKNISQYTTTFKLDKLIYALLFIMLIFNLSGYTYLNFWTWLFVLFLIIKTDWPTN